MARYSIGDSPMPKVTVTLHDHQLVFLSLFKQDGGTVSGGFRQLLKAILEADEEARDTMEQAEWMIQQARLALGEDSTQKERLKWVTDKQNWSRLLQEYN